MSLNFFSPLNNFYFLFFGNSSLLGSYLFIYFLLCFWIRGYRRICVTPLNVLLWLIKSRFYTPGSPGGFPHRRPPPPNPTYFYDPRPHSTDSSRRGQLIHLCASFQSLAAPHLHIYCLAPLAGEWLMGGRPPEWRAGRGGGGFCRARVLLISAEDDGILAPSCLSPPPPSLPLSHDNGLQDCFLLMRINNCWHRDERKPRCRFSPVWLVGDEFVRLAAAEGGCTDTLQVAAFVFWFGLTGESGVACAAFESSCFRVKFTWKQNRLTDTKQIG